MHKSVDTCADKQSARCSVGVSSINQWADRCRCPSDANRTNVWFAHTMMHFSVVAVGAGRQCRRQDNLVIGAVWRKRLDAASETTEIDESHSSTRASRTRILYFDEASHCRTRCTSCHKQNTTNKHARVSWMETFPVPTESFPKAAICNHPELF